MTILPAWRDMKSRSVPSPAARIPVGTPPTDAIVFSPITGTEAAEGSGIMRRQHEKARDAATRRFKFGRLLEGTQLTSPQTGGPELSAMSLKQDYAETRSVAV